MNLRKRLLSKSQLYVIIDKKTAGKKIFKFINSIKGSKAEIIQLRDKFSRREDILKEAFALQRLLTGRKKIFIINDYLDVAKIVDSDGIHLGQDDVPIELARKVLGDEKIIGLSCHDLKQAIEAQNRGADYIGLGPIFPTPTKPEYKPVGLNLIRELKAKLKIPLFVIGNINRSNINEVRSFGAERVAICRAILKAKNIPSQIQYFYDILH